ncbi:MULTISPECIES: cupin domain-containing protein [Kitasatospora]|uniref:cupin domain-containing protein n=1 Tax=Kitasatospora TaxID=2063 RepID=UPI000C6FD62A|nr:cupin domain-containing protein [Kitasatospora sp. GP30]MDH6141800.1 quercetin dioxygenase-like cupin family protein [Kitasatospora sp. GP30]
MSYPDPRYLGENGEINAVFRPADRGPDVVSPTGDRTHYLATQATTGGEFGLYQVDLAAHSRGAATHFHRAISESFFILSGQVRLFDGDQWTTGRSGDFLHVPVGGLHAFRNESDDPATMLLLFTPGAPREEYFERVVEMAQRGGPEFQEFLVRHDSFFVDRG